MEILKTAIQTRFKSLLPISVALIFSAMILMLRMKLNKSFAFVFLIWNVFLAIIPFVITMYLKTSKNLNKRKNEQKNKVEHKTINKSPTKGLFRLLKT